MGANSLVHATLGSVCFLDVRAFLFPKLYLFWVRHCQLQKSCSCAPQSRTTLILYSAAQGAHIARAHSLGAPHRACTDGPWVIFLY